MIFLTSDDEEIESSPIWNMECFRTFLGFASISVVMNVLQFVRGVEAGAKVVRILIVITRDMFAFLVIMMFLNVAFAMWFHLALRAASQRVEEGAIPYFGTFRGAFFETLKMGWF